MELRVNRPITAQTYNGLRRAVGWKTIEERQAQAGIQHARYLLTAVEAGETVGMLRVIGDGGYIFYIADVIVLPAFQGHGIGRALVERAMALIRGSLEEGQCAFVNLMANQDKERFYAHFGFECRPDSQKGLGAGMTQWILK